MSTHDAARDVDVDPSCLVTKYILSLSNSCLRIETERLVILDKKGLSELSFQWPSGKESSNRF